MDPRARVSARGDATCVGGRPATATATARISKWLTRVNVSWKIRHSLDYVSCSAHRVVSARLAAAQAAARSLGA
jgi:hypothetical protein